MVTKKKKEGRPWFDGLNEEEVVRKLEEAFAIGCTNREACLYANITEASYYNFVKTKPELSERFEILKDKPVLKARSTVVKGLDQPEHAKWFLERKLRKEFGSKDDNIPQNVNIVMIAYGHNNPAQLQSKASPTGLPSERTEIQYLSLEPQGREVKDSPEQPD